MSLICKSATVKSGRGITSGLISSASKLIRKIPIGSVVNTVIDALPIELHLPGGYQYCGPGTDLKTRLSRGDPGINKLDQACKDHDIAYSKHSDTENRKVADKSLASRAWERVKSKDASLAERAAALAVATAMKGKTMIGGGRRRKGKRKPSTKRGRGVTKRKSRGKKKNTSVYQMVKKGRGLYLKPYRNVY